MRELLKRVRLLFSGRRLLSEMVVADNESTQYVEREYETWRGPEFEIACVFKGGVTLQPGQSMTVNLDGGASPRSGA